MIDVVVKGFHNRMNRLNSQASSIPWYQVGIFVQKSIHLNFEQGGRPIRWAPRKVEKPWPVLQKSKKLKNATYIEPIRNGVVIGNRTPYQAVQNFGFPPRNIAAREYHMLQPSDRLFIQGFVKKHILS